MLVTYRKLFEPAFIETGFCDWKNAVRAFERHAKCDCHQEAVDSWNCWISTFTTSVYAKLDYQLAQSQHIASKVLTVITTSFFTRQGLAIRGRIENSGNSFHLLLTQSRDVPELASFLQQRNAYISHDIQNEILELIAHAILQLIVHGIARVIYHILQ